MEYEKYLLVFAAGYNNDEMIADEIISQLSVEMDKFGIEDIEVVESSISILIKQYILKLSDISLNDMNNDYSTIRIRYKEPIGLEVNLELDDFIATLIKSYDYPSGAHVTYLVNDNGHLSFHQKAIVVGFWGGYREDGELEGLEKAITPEILYRILYKEELKNEDYSHIAKMLLVVEDDNGRNYDF